MVVTTKEKGFSTKISLNSGQANHHYEVSFQNRITPQEWTENLQRFNAPLQRIVSARQKMMGKIKEII